LLCSDIEKGAVKMGDRKRDDFSRLLSLHFDGGLSADEMAEFKRALVEDPTKRKEFARASILHDQIRSVLALDTIAVKDRSAGARPASRSAAAAIPNKWWIALAACLCVAATAGVVAMTKGGMGEAPRRPLAVASPIPTSFNVAEGTATIAIPKVGQVFLDGPAGFELVSPHRAKLTHGRIRVRVSGEEGHGFAVETPHGNITDLGTEFGVSVSDEDGQGKTSLVVFDGSVDLHRTPDKSLAVAENTIERIGMGEGVSFGHEGDLHRIVSITTGTDGSFEYSDVREGARGGVIQRVSDNISTPHFKKFYEIVPGGLREDALAFVEWPEHEWNGATEAGLPDYLRGADYIKTFDTDKLRNDVEIRVTLSAPARLFVFYDERLEPPQWLVEGFRKTDDVVGLDAGSFPRDGVTHYFHHDTGAGKSVEVDFPVWERVVTEPGEVVLGPNSATSDFSSMYGIAAIRLDDSAEAE
jgi:hypothetical protein